MYDVRCNDSEMSLRSIIQSVRYNEISLVADTGFCDYFRTECYLLGGRKIIASIYFSHFNGDIVAAS